MIAVIALLGGATLAAITAAQPASSHAHHGRLATAAAYLGISESQLRGELRSGKSLAQIASARSGKSQAGLIEALVAAPVAHLNELAARLKARVRAQVERAGGPLAGGPIAGGPRGSARPGFPAKRYLGLSGAQLRARRRSGMTLAQIADATPGRSEAGLIAAVLAARRQVLDARVAAGTLTPAQEQTRLARLAGRVKAEVNRVPRAGGHAARGHRAGGHAARGHRAGGHGADGHGADGHRLIQSAPTG
ncbi:MAG TPA: hypothetical protein VKG82_02750 [Solirubrobacteraceae bacterium]|nr:hypothetical protein [Solirubrobacteraceae bacterium]